MVITLSSHVLFTIVGWKCHNQLLHFSHVPWEVECMVALLESGQACYCTRINSLVISTFFFLNQGYQWNVCWFPLLLCLIFLCHFSLFFVNFLTPFFSLFSIVFFFLLEHICLFGQGADGGHFGKYFSIMLAISNWDPVARIPSPLLLENEIKWWVYMRADVCLSMLAFSKWKLFQCEICYIYVNTEQLIELLNQI